MKSTEISRGELESESASERVVLRTQAIGKQALGARSVGHKLSVL
jgi:hypothetical protein